MEPFKWGMIGSVARAEAFYAETRFASNPQTLHAFLPSRNGDAVSGERLSGTIICNSISELLAIGIDAVYIASPYLQHFAQTKQCIRHRLPVLCERPVADSPRHLADLLKLSEQYTTFFMEALWIRFMPVVRKVLSIFNNNLVGKVESLSASVYYKQHDSLLPESADIGGGALFELGIFPLFLSCLFLGRPSYVKATGKLNVQGEDDSFSAFLSYNKGQYAFIEASTLEKKDSYIDINGDKGNIYVRNPWSIKPEGLEVDLADGTKMVHKSEWKGIGLHFEMDEVYNCIQKGLIESPFYTHEFNMDVMKVIDTIRKQLKK